MESRHEVRAECEQREKINTRGAIHMAYACNTEMKLTRHLGVHMADRRENHPATLHSRAKCLKKHSSPFEALHRHPSGSLTRRVEFVKRICNFHSLTASTLMLDSEAFDSQHGLSHILHSKSYSPPPQMGLRRRRPERDGCDAEALGLCSARYPPHFLGYL